jgi:biopolymer transport protein ExbD
VRYRVGPFTTTSRAELRRRLEGLRRADPELKCALDAREGVTYGDTVAVLDDTTLSGFREVTFLAAR